MVLEKYLRDELMKPLLFRNCKLQTGALTECLSMDNSNVSKDILSRQYNKDYPD
jgi:hypothetical protein